MATQLTEEERRRAALALNPVTPGMISSAETALRAKGPMPDEMRRDSGPVTEPIPNRRGERAPPAAKVKQAPPEAVARTPDAAPRSSGPATRPVVRSQGPAPAAVVAANGVMAPPPASAPRETPAAAPEKEQEKDMHAFHYLGQVQAMEAKAMALGRPEEAARVRGEYNRLIDGQFRSMETDWKTKTLPQVQSIQKMLLDHQGKQVPKELVVKARETTLQAAQQQQQMMGFLYGLARNDATKPLGIQYFNESEMIQPGDKLADLVVVDGMLVGVDEGGQPVQMSGGQDFRFPIEAAEQLYKSLFESERRDNVIVPKGAKLVNTNDGRVIADNPDLNAGRDDGPTRSEDLSAVRFAYDGIANALGLKLSDTGKLMEDIDPSARAAHTQLTAEAGLLVRSGVPPEQAVEQVMQKHRGSAAATAPSTSGRYDGVRPWRR